MLADAERAAEVKPDIVPGCWRIGQTGLAPDRLLIIDKAEDALHRGPDLNPKDVNLLVLRRGLLLSLVFFTFSNAFVTPDSRRTSSLPDYFSCCECFPAPNVDVSVNVPHVAQYTWKYTSSPLERSWLNHKNDPSWLFHPCAPGKNDTSMSVAVRTWMTEVEHPGNKEVFSQYVRSDNAIFFIEPLSFLLRHPLAWCGKPQRYSRESAGRKDWLVLADETMLPKVQHRRILIDAGASYYDSGVPGGGVSTKWFVDAYKQRGIVFDAIYGWEAKTMDMQRYWSSVPKNVRKTLTLYNRPAAVDPSSSDNPLAKLVSECRTEDFCVVKIDVDTPSVELPWVQQILQCHDVSARIDEFFFEHHAHGLMERKYHPAWDSSRK